MKNQNQMQMQIQQAWRKAREINPSLAENPPDMNGASSGFVTLGTLAIELEAKILELEARLSAKAFDVVDLGEPPSYDDFEITSINERIDNEDTRVEITGVHSGTGEEECLTVPLRNPTPNTMKELRKLEGTVFPKPDRRLISDFSDLGVRIALVTPYEALRFLANNKMQRSLTMSAVERYSQAHKEGRWLPTNQGAGFDRNGLLLDGQHRLFTCLMSGKPMAMLLAWGLDPEVRAVVDNGVRRTPGQVDDMMGGRSDDLPIGKTIEHFTAKIYLSHGGSTNKAGLYYLSIKNLYLRELAWINEYIRVNPKYPAAKKTMLNTATVVAAFLMLHKAFPEETPVFAEQVFQGDNPDRNPAVRLARDYLASRQEKNDDYMDTIRKIVTCFFAFKDGTVIKELRGITKKPTNAKKEVEVSSSQWRRNRFNETLHMLWSRERPLLPDDALKTISWDPYRKA